MDAALWAALVVDAALGGDGGDGGPLAAGACGTGGRATSALGGVGGCGGAGGVADEEVALAAGGSPGCDGGSVDVVLATGSGAVSATLAVCGGADVEVLADGFAGATGGSSETRAAASSNKSSSDPPPRAAELAAAAAGGTEDAPAPPAEPPCGGATRTIEPHFGQGRICPIADASATRKRARQVVQEIENGSTDQTPGDETAWARRRRRRA